METQHFEKNHPRSGRRHPGRQRHGFLTHLFWPRVTATVLVWLFLVCGCGSVSRAEHFNESAAEAESRPDDIMNALAIKPGMAIADIGAGGGYFTYRFAEQTGPTGPVYAVDVNADFLKNVKDNAAQRGLNNIQTVLAPAPTDSGLRPKSVDLVFLRNVYHHLEQRPEYFRALKAALKPGARLVVVEYSGGGWDFVSLFGHSTPPGDIRAELEAAGYRHQETRDFLRPRQSYQVFVAAE